MVNSLHFTYSYPKRVSFRRASHCRSSQRCVILHDFSTRPLPYNSIWKLQREFVQEISLKQSSQKLLLVQHEPVYTLGAGSTVDHLCVSEDDLPYPLVRTERGGEITYHGPGQLILYPLLDLGEFHKDLHWFLRSLEEVVIRALWEVSGILGERVTGLTGVWVNDEKVAAIGIRARKWITYHGVAINVSVNLDPYKYIIPCGIAGKSVTSVRQILSQNGQETASDEELMMEYRVALIDTFANVFDVSIKHEEHSTPIANVI